MALKISKITDVDKETKKIKLAGEKEWRFVGKKVFQRLKIEVGETIEWEQKGANINILRNINDEKVSHKNKTLTKGKSIFSYPYNFVSLGKVDNIQRHKIQKGKNTGKVICTLNNITPIFTHGKSKDDPQKKGHMDEDFLIENGKYILPASSLKGEIRNIIEVLTTSCMRNVEEERLEKRENASGQPLTLGIIKRLPGNGTSGLIVEADKIKINQRVLKRKNEYSRNGKDLNSGFYTIKVNSKIYSFVSSNPRQSRAIEEEKDFQAILERGKEEAILWISSQIYNKKYEKILIPKKGGKSYEFSEEEYEDLKYLLSQRQERDKKEGTDFYLKTLKSNDAVIFKTNGNKAVNLAFSEIPRLRYQYSPYQLVPKEFRTCSSKENLCFSCRLFGTTGNAQEKSSNVSVAGRIYFSDAEIEKDIAKVVQGYETLKSLGEPHPTLESFYLEQGSYDKEHSYIRGRKFYWHHSEKIEAGEQFEKYMPTIRAENKEAHNASLKFLKPNNTFHFEVHFKDLTDEELGVLLYSLELEEGLLHKFGKEKAFGFGSAKISIQHFFLDSPQKYKNFSTVYVEGEKERYIKLIQDKYLNTERKEIQELKAILSAKNSLDFKKSPFPEDYIYKNGQRNERRGYNTLNWFVNRKREEKQNFKLPHILDYSKE